MVQNLFGFTDLEDRLLSADGAAEVARTVERLRAVRAELDTMIGAGLSPTDFEDAQRLKAALTASERIVLDSTHLKGAHS